nr:hypothetical protein [Kibdelosporangium sp. MJ126-NF4]CTQ91718.1 hypothetical protein [Kibdelosporangium sp. MJ126-NF4]
MQTYCFAGCRHPHEEVPEPRCYMRRMINQWSDRGHPAIRYGEHV